MKRKYIICSPTFNENIGGFIALHRLCHELNISGEQAYIWPMFKPVFSFSAPLRSIYKIVEFNLRATYSHLPSIFTGTGPFFGFLTKKLSYKFELSADLNTPLAKYSDLKDSIVVYPEIVSGNPLGVKRVVRWLLYKPGAMTGEINYGKTDLFFYYQKAFIDPNLNIDIKNELQILWVRDDVYYQQNFGKRKGICYTLRKGADREIQHDLSKSTCIDGLGHEEIASIFNECKYFISYDLYTMYSSYAALCGCISIVVPIEGLSKEEWIPEPEKRYGIAYGEDDVQYAMETLNLFRKEVQISKEYSVQSVKRFVEKTRAVFK